MNPRTIVDVSDWPTAGSETMGSKRKKWLAGPDGARWLFKHRLSETTGDDWAEVIAADVAALLGVPHATVELATLSGAPGVISRDFTEGGLKALEHGNELLVRRDPTYPKERLFRVSKHTVECVLDVLTEIRATAPRTVTPARGFSEAGSVFLGYLMLDALVANQDRHHENWGVLVTRERGAGPPELAPSFDHASSLAWSLTDLERQRRLNTRDRNSDVAAFARRAKSALYPSEGAARPLHPIDAFCVGGVRYPGERDRWLDRLRGVPPDVLVECIERVPSDRMSQLSRRFAEALVLANRTSLMSPQRP